MKSNSWTTAGQAKDISSSPNPLVKVLQRGRHWVWGPNRRRAVKQHWTILIMPPFVDTFSIVSIPLPKQKTKLMCKLKCEKCNRTVYRNSVRDHLMSFNTFLPSLNEHTRILQPLSYLNAFLKRATCDSIPKFKPKITVKEVRNRSWFTKIHEEMPPTMVGVAKKTGSPTNTTNDTVINIV